MQLNFDLTPTSLTSVESAKTAEWISLTAPTAAELNQIEADYGVPQDFLTAALDPHEEPRVVGLHPDATGPALLVVRVPLATTNAQGDRVYATCPLALILDERRLITVAGRTLPLMADFVEAADFGDDCQALTLRLIQAVLRVYVSAMDQMDEETHELEERLTTAAHNTLLYEIIALQRSIVYFQQSLTRIQNQVVTPMVATSRWFIQKAYLIALHKVAVEAQQALMMADTTAAVLDQYTTMVSSVVGNNLNLIMKVLTSVSIIMTIPAIVSGIWGMNTWLPGKTPWDFWALLALMAVLCAGTAWWLKKKDYF